ncbi:MAG: hypothetical protein QOE56_866 [Solirubrobacterales bacterium]|jgi:hypothetical protein|nr:hypothetical protein [Solirubrobacterales bacterium]
MRRRLLIPVLFALAVLLGAGAAWGELSQKGNLRISFDGGFTPRALPRERPAPITVDVEGSIGTTDGSRPPALRRFEIELNRAGRLSTRGLPACSMPLLQSTTSEAALARCRPAAVGHGHFAAAVESGGKLIPAGGRILAFNGTYQGGPAVLLHFYTAVPARVTLIMPLALTRKSKGQFGTVLATKIPILAGGLASITKIKLEIGREYGYQGRRLSFISASCAAPAGFPGALFSFARGNFHFADGRTIVTTLTRDCRVRGG